MEGFKYLPQGGWELFWASMIIGAPIFFIFWCRTKEEDEKRREHFTQVTAMLIMMLFIGFLVIMSIHAVWEFGRWVISLLR